MIPTQRAVLTLALSFACVACERSSVPEPRREVPVADPVPAGVKTRLGGELTLSGPIANTDEGAVFVSVFPIGVTGRDREPVLFRTYLLADPEWRRSAGLSRLRFDLGAEDAPDEKAPRLSREMELVVRFDPDANPATVEPNAKEVAKRVKVGDTDLSIAIDADATDVPRAAKSDER